MKNILLLGSNGFIGRNLKEYLSLYSEEYTVSTPSRSELNLINEQEVFCFLKNNYFDVVIHAAVFNPLRIHENKVYDELDADLRMFFNFEKHSSMFGKMLYFGSGAEFDKSMPVNKVSEDTSKHFIPHNDYGLAKYIIGRHIENSNNIYNLRIFGLFGKYENWKTTFISGACCKALKGLPITIRQNVWFDYLYIDDFCKIVKYFIDAEPHAHTYNVTTGIKRDLVTIANDVIKLCKADVPIYICKDGLANEYTSDNTRLLTELGGFEFTAWEQCISKLIEYYKEKIDEIDLYSLLYQ